MNLDLFDDLNGFILRERENSLPSADNDLKTNNGSAVSRFPANTPLAMAYVPFQQWSSVYGDDDAFVAGTLFPDLDLPFMNGGNSK